MKGMQKIRRGRGIRGKLEYSFDNKKGDKGVIVGGNMTGTTPRELSKEFSASIRLRPEIDKQVWHNSLRLPKGEHLSPEQWNEIGNEYMRRMGFSPLHQRVFIRHDDEDGEHIHIDACRISLDGSLYLGAQENLRSTQIIHQLEIDYGLNITSMGLESDKPKRRAPQQKEIAMAERTGTLPVEMRMQAMIDDAAKDKPDFETLVTRLESMGMTIIPTGATGQPQGISFGLDGDVRKGSKLGSKSYAWAGLKGRVDYDPVRDQHVIDRLRVQRDSAAQEEIGELAPLMTAEPPKKKWGRTIDNAFEKEPSGDATVYKWAGRNTTALIDNGDSISVINGNNKNAVRASLQLAMDKGWKSVKATGGHTFRRETWMAGNLLGLEIQGYEPTEQDREELKQALAEKQRARDERKNQRNAEAGRAEHSGHQDSTGAGRPDRDSSQELQPTIGRPRNQDIGREESDGRARQQDNRAVELQADYTGAGHTRSADMADVGGVRNNRADLGGVRDAAQSISDLAAPIVFDSEDRGTEQENRGERPDTVQPIAKEHAAKIAAWERQSEALDAEKYRITLKPRAEKDSKGRKLFDQNYGNKGKKSDREAAGVSEVFWTKDEITTEIAKLRAKNAQGYDVYITPISDTKHFIVVDDLTQASYDDMLKAGIKPAIVQNSSDNNKQAIIVIDKIKGDNEQKMANEIVMRLNRKWGDPNFSGVVHPFRLAGFSNKKAGKNNYITTVENSICRKCDISSVAMQKLRTVDIQKKQEADRLKNELSIKKETDKEFSRRVQNIESGVQTGADTVELAYRREVRKAVGLAKSKGWDIDWSKVDYAATKALLKDGYIPGRIEKAIVDASPGLAGRHSDAARYAADTVRNASNDKDVAKMLAERAQRAQKDRGLEL